MSATLKKLCFEFLNMQPILPGTVKGQYSVCGHANCRCMDKTNPQKHGPQNKLSFSLAGKSSTIFVRKSDAKIAHLMTDNFARMRDLQNDILAESVRIYREEGADASHDKMKIAIAHALSKLAGVKFDTAKLEKLEASVDKLKAKAADKSAQVRKNTVQIKDLAESRDKWKQEALASRKEILQQKTEIGKFTRTCSEQHAESLHLKDALKKR